MVTRDELVSTYPRLWHMAMDGSWPWIKQHGLWSTSSLLDLYEVNGEARKKIKSCQRPKSVQIQHPGLPSAMIRDQKPMSDSALLKCLGDGISPSQWYETLNKKVFFWLSKKRLRTLLGARAYRSHPQIVLTVTTKSIVDEFGDEILLSPINSGSTINQPQPRGLDTFLPIDDYPFAAMAKKRSRKKAVAELTIPGGVAGIADHVTVVHRVHGEIVEVVWQSPNATDADSVVAA